MKVLRSAWLLLSLGWRFLVLLSLIIQAAWLYGLSCFQQRVDSDRRPFALSEKTLETRYRRFAERFVRIATQFRGGLIKVGQVASLRMDILPAVFSEVLSTLQDQVEPRPFIEIRSQLESALGADWQAEFVRLDPQAVAAASLGQVHRACSRTGEELALKIVIPKWRNR